VNIAEAPAYGGLGVETLLIGKTYATNFLPSLESADRLGFARVDSVSLRPSASENRGFTGRVNWKKSAKLPFVAATFKAGSAPAEDQSGSFADSTREMGLGSVGKFAQCDFGGFPKRETGCGEF
jgi:hypothetical protein